MLGKRFVSDILSCVGLQRVIPMTLRILFCIVCKPVAFQKHNARVPLITLDEHEDRIGGAWRCHGHHRLLCLQVRQDL